MPTTEPKFRLPLGGGLRVFLNRSTKSSAIIAIGIFAIIAGCSREDKKKFSGASQDKSAFGSNGEESAGGPEASKELQFKRSAIRNFEELKNSMAAVTCISDDDKTEANSGRTFGQFFRDVSGNLPTTNDVDKYIAANIVATMNLASHACLLSISLPKAASCKWSAGLRDKTDPETAFSDANIMALGKSIYQNIWGLDVSQLSDSSGFLNDMKTEINGGTIGSEQVVSLKAKIQEQLTAANVPADQQPRKIVEGVLVSICSAALSAPPFTAY